MIIPVPITDLTYITQVAKGNTDFIHDMVDIFISKTPAYLEEMRSYLDAQDWPALGFLAHKLKATYAYMGISTLKQILVLIEKSAKTETDLELIPGHLDFLVLHTKQAMQELQQYRSDN